MKVFLLLDQECCTMRVFTTAEKANAWLLRNFKTARDRKRFDLQEIDVDDED